MKFKFEVPEKILVFLGVTFVALIVFVLTFLVTDGFAQSAVTTVVDWGQGYLDPGIYRDQITVVCRLILATILAKLVQVILKKVVRISFQYGRRCINDNARMGVYST